jgi:hypothetical protein
MRTKALLGLAALAVSALTSVAADNVYSLNIVGYVNVTMPAGNYTYVNPLDLDGTNSAGNVLKLPDSTTFAFWTGSAFDYWFFDSTYGGTYNGWFSDSSGATEKAPPILTLGKGFYVNPPSQFVNTFVGNVVPAPGQTNSANVAAGNQLVGSVMPVGGSVAATGAGAINLVLPDSTTVANWTGGAFEYWFFDSTYGGTFNGWFSDSSGATEKAPPSLAVGRSLYVNAPSAFVWKQWLP